MDNFNYQAYIKSGKIHGEKAILTESEQVSEKKEDIEEVGKGYFKKEHGVGKDSLKETIAEAKAKIDEGSYPFDQCLADNEGKYGAKGAAKVCGAIKAAYGEGQVNEMDEVSWNDKNNPTRGASKKELDPKKVGQSTAAYSVNEDARTDAEQEGYKDGFEDAKDDIEGALKKMKVSELKDKIKTEILSTLSEDEEDLEAMDADSLNRMPHADSVNLEEADEEEVDVDIDVEDEVTVDAEGDDIEIEKKAVKAKVEVGLSPEEEIVQDSLKAAMDAAQALGSQKLADQIGNTITFFTREFVVGNNTD